MKKKEQLILPDHVAIIMDGNGRWAKKRGLPRSAGHKEGARRLIEITMYANDLGLKYLTVYAFSTENWSRPKDEVDYLMQLPLDFLKEYKDKMQNKNIRLKVIGDRDKLPKELQDKIIEVEEHTGNNTGLTFIIALNYGSKLEILEATKSLFQDIIEKKIAVGDIKLTDLDAHLYTSGIPDVDLLIRTSNELRLSNFLLWQIAYSELYFSKLLWPSFHKRDFMRAIQAYNKRNRRFGKVGN